MIIFGFNTDVTTFLFFLGIEFKMILSGLLCSSLLMLVFGITTLAEHGLHQHELLTQLKIPQCREMCMEQVSFYYVIN